MGGRMRHVSTTALLMTVLCLLLCLHQTHQEEVQEEGQQQQLLTVGAECGGEKKKLCPSGTKCQLGHQERYYCRLLVGQNCSRSDPYYYCEEEAGCDRKRNICTLGWGASCRGKHKQLCMTGYSCDANFVCRRKVGSNCLPAYRTCGAGHECKNRKCSCIPELWKRKRDVCVPAKGYVGGKCLENNVCKAPHSECNDRNRCVCLGNYSKSSHDFSCKAPLGSNCTHTYNCTEDAFCDPADNKCRLKPGQICTGDRANFCQVGKPCIDGRCRNKVGETCGSWFSTNICEPPSSCWPKSGGNVCGIESYKSCAKHRDGCVIKSTFCDPKLLRCQKKIDESCFWDTACPYGAVCEKWFCKCLHGGYWNATRQVCVPADGKAGGKCLSEKKKCEDPSAMCNDDGVCECKKDFYPSSQNLQCNLRGPRCFVHNDGDIETFFGEKIEVDLPCGFKLAKFRCGSMLVEVSADNTYTTKIKNTYISSINVTITGQTKAGTTATNTYTVAYPDVARYLAKNKTKGSAWRVIPGQDPAVKDDHVELITRIGTRDSILLRKSMKITYIPVDTTKKVNRFFGEVLIQCGMKTFKSLEKFPESLCGRPEDKEEGIYKKYAKRVEKQLKREIPDIYPSLSRKAFSSDRLTDRAILLDQTVSQRNVFCQQASTILKSGCPALQAKLYNCSFMYDTSYFDHKMSYAFCTAKAIPEPAKLLVSCLNVNCNRLNEDNKEITCQTLKTASNKCGSISGTQTPSDLMSLANCTST